MKEKLHYFLDEAGDTTFYGKRGLPLIGTEGVSRYFLMGMIRVNEPLQPLRDRIAGLSTGVLTSEYYKGVPTVEKHRDSNQYLFHAKNDKDEIRKQFFDFILSVDCKLCLVISEKDYQVFSTWHKKNEATYYADLLTNLLVGELNATDQLVLNIASRSSCTNNANLTTAIDNARKRSQQRHPELSNSAKVSINVQTLSSEPILSIVDYLLWCVQRLLERKEGRFLRYMSGKIDKITMIDRGHALRTITAEELLALIKTP